MLNKTTIRAAMTLAAGAMIGFAGQAAVAQYGNQSIQYGNGGSQGSDRSSGPSDRYREGYRTGYSAGYDAARNLQRYDDRPEVTAESHGDPGAR